MSWPPIEDLQVADQRCVGLAVELIPPCCVRVGGWVGAWVGGWVGVEIRRLIVLGDL